MKRIIYLTVIALMLMACSDSQYTNKYRYNDFIVQYKINKESSIGSIATVYGDRIYYFSDEQETPGIYSMDFNGNDVRCELEARDIQKIQIKDDILYYLTMEKVIYGSKGSQWGNRYYSLKSLDLKMGNTQSYDIIEEAVIKKKYSSDYRGIWDFYRMSEDRFIIANIQLSGHRQIFTVESNMIDESGDIYSFGEYKEISIKPENKEYPKGLDLYNLVSDLDMLLVSRGDESYTGLYTDHYSIYDGSLNSSFTVTDTIIYGKAEPRIFYKKNGNYIIGSQNYIIEYNAEKEKIVKQYAFNKNAEKVIIFDEKYVLVKMKKKEEIYNFDDESFMAEKILTNDKGRIVDIHEDYYILIDNNALYKKNISDEKDIWKIDLGHDYIKREHKVEIAGDWLFIKSFNLEAEQSTLEEKINIATGERIGIEK